MRYILMILIISFHLLEAAFENGPTSSLNKGLGDMKLNGIGQGIDLYHDPGAVSRFKHPQLAVSINRLFNLKVLQTQSFALTGKYRNVYWMTGAARFGNSLYKEIIGYGGGGIAYSDQIAIGFNINYYYLFIKNYNQAYTIGLTFSCRYKIKPSLTWAGALININQPVIGRSKEPIPQLFVTGIIYKPLPQIAAQIEWEQDPGYSGRFKYGIQYTFLPIVSLSIGHAMNPGKITMAVNMCYKNIQISMAYIYEQNLNVFTRQMDMAFGFSAH